MRPRFPISDHLANKDFQVKGLPHENKYKKKFHEADLDQVPRDVNGNKIDLRENENSEESPKAYPYSDAEYEMHRIRDRIRIRLNLIDSNFRNFEQQIIEEQYKQMKKPKNLDALLDGDLNESDKEIIPFKESDEEDEVKRCIKNNRRLMEKMNSKNYKDRVLSTYEN